MFAVNGEEVCGLVEPGCGLSSVRAKARRLLNASGIDNLARTEILIIINELGMNILRHAGSGEICLKIVGCGGRRGIFIVANDSGPGIGDLEAALQPGFSEDKGLGLGLAAIHRLSDEVRIATLIPHGTRVEVFKWIS